MSYLAPILKPIVEAPLQPIMGSGESAPANAVQDREGNYVLDRDGNYVLESDRE